VAEHPAAAKKAPEPALQNTKPAAVQGQDATAAAPRQADVKPVPELSAKIQEALPAAPVSATPALQQAMALTQAQGSAMTKLTQPVGSQGWDQALGQKSSGWQAAHSNPLP